MEWAGVRQLCQLTHSGSTRRQLGGRTPPTVPALGAKKGMLSLKAKKGHAPCWREHTYAPRDKQSRDRSGQPAGGEAAGAPPRAA